MRRSKELTFGSMEDGGVMFDASTTGMTIWVGRRTHDWPLSREECLQLIEFLVDALNPYGDVEPEGADVREDRGGEGLTGSTGLTGCTGPAGFDEPDESDDDDEGGQFPPVGEPEEADEPDDFLSYGRGGRAEMTAHGVERTGGTCVSPTSRITSLPHRGRRPAGIGLYVCDRCRCVFVPEET